MALLRRQIRHPAVSAEAPSPPFGTDAEDPVVRQYRFLLRTAPTDALEAAHVEALPALDRAQRAVLLRTTQDQLVAGLRLDPDDTVPLAHLLTLGERRVPGAVLRACEPNVLRRLARAVIDSEAVFGLFGGYAVWDGAEPEPPPVVDHRAGFDEPWHQKLGAPPMYAGPTAISGGGGP